MYPDLGETFDNTKHRPDPEKHKNILEIMSKMLNPSSQHKKSIFFRIVVKDKYGGVTDFYEIHNGFTFGDNIDNKNSTYWMNPMTDQYMKNFHGGWFGFDYNYVAGGTSNQGLSREEIERKQIEEWAKKTARERYRIHNGELIDNRDITNRDVSPNNKECNQNIITNKFYEKKINK